MRMKAPGHVNQHHGLTGKVYRTDETGHADLHDDDVKGAMDAGWTVPTAPSDGQPVEETPVDAPAEPETPTETLPRTGTPLRQDGPTLEEYVKAGYSPTGYPPVGYAAKDSEGWTEEQARRAAAEKPQS